MNKTSFEDMAKISAAYIEAKDQLSRIVNYKGDKRRRTYKRMAEASHIWRARMDNFAALLGLPTAGEVFYNDPAPDYCKPARPAQEEPAPAEPKKTFKVDGYFVESMYTCVYMQFADSWGESCRLLSERQSVVNGSLLYTPLRVRKIHATTSGDPYIILRGRRLLLDNFICAGSPWSSIPAGHTIEY